MWLTRVALASLLWLPLAGAQESVIGLCLPSQRAQANDAERARRIAGLVAGRTAVPLSPSPLDLGDAVRHADQLFWTGAIDDSAAAFDALLDAGARAPHRLAQPSSWLGAHLTRASLALSRGERKRAKELLDRLLRSDPAFTLPDDSRPQLRRALEEERARLGPRPPLRPGDIGEACRNAIVVVLRPLERGTFDLTRFDRCRFVADTVASAGNEDADLARRLAPSIETVAAQQDEPSTLEAKARFRVGQEAYHLGKYRDAIAAFQAGYRLAGRPEFLINLGQAYRQQGDPAVARSHFARFLAEAADDHPQREAIERIVADLDRALPFARPVVRTVLAPSAVNVTTSPASSQAEPRRPAWRRPLFWVALVGGAAVLAGAGVALALTIDRYPQGSLDRIQASQP